MMKHLLMVVAALLLTACAQEPDEKQINQALSQAFQELNSTTQVVDNVFGHDNIVSKAFKVNFVESKKMGSCTSNEDGKSFSCDVKIVSENSLAGKASNITRVKFMQATDGSWSVVNADSLLKAMN